MSDSPKRIGIAADHGGFELKNRLAAMLCEAGYEVSDFGDLQQALVNDTPATTLVDDDKS